jgi:hypothetical protein
MRWLRARRRAALELIHVAQAQVAVRVGVSSANRRGRHHERAHNGRTEDTPCSRLSSLREFTSRASSARSSARARWLDQPPRPAICAATSTSRRRAPGSPRSTAVAQPSRSEREDRAASCASETPSARAARTRCRSELPKRDEHAEQERDRQQVAREEERDRREKRERVAGLEAETDQVFDLAQQILEHEHAAERGEPDAGVDAHVAQDEAPEPERDAHAHILSSSPAPGSARRALLAPT